MPAFVAAWRLRISDWGDIRCLPARQFLGALV
jgi:hypothetical protein